MSTRNTFLATLLLTGGAVSGCASTTRSQDLAYVERPVEQLYLNATERLESGRYDEAVQYFNEVERQHPYSEWASRSQLMVAYANYEARRYEEAISSAQRYLGLQQGSDGAAYAYYLIALSYFEQIVDVGRDQGTTEFARDALLEVVRRFPESDYARDARLKLDMVNDQLAGKEMTVGRYYLRNDQTLAAINRFSTVVTEYGTTSHAPEALYRLIEGYLTLGLVDEAKAAGAVLAFNHPDTRWYEDAYGLLTGRGVALDVAPEGKRKKILGLF